VECRSCDAELIELLATVDHPTTRVAVTAERSLLAALEAGCSAPIGGYATVSRATPAGRARVSLAGVVLGMPHAGGVEVSAGSEMMVVRERGDADAGDPQGLGRDLARRMLARGAARLVGAPGNAARDSASENSATDNRASKDGTTAGTATTNREDVHD
jgi:hydroxymethylbilane synthase